MLGKGAIVTGGASGIGAATVERFVAEGARVVIADLNDELGASLAERLGPDSARYLRTDVTSQEDVQRLFDEAESFVAADRYDAFGRTISQSGSLASANPYRFSSKEYYATSFFYAYRHRLYDPALQRWITEDPLGIDQGPNLYQFVGNSPVHRIDPWGLSDAIISDERLEMAGRSRVAKARRVEQDR
jgi:RHS repeat-associated protein